MIRALPAPRAMPWRRVLAAVWIGVNIGLVVWAPERPGPHNVDWQLFLALRTTAPYDTDLPFRYSPVAGWLFVAITYLGYWVWFATHVVALWLLRFSPLVVLLTLTAWGWWLDAMMGNAFTFVFIAGALALRGSRGWALVYIALLCLMPRPVQVPLAVWLLWKTPGIRLPAVVIVAAHGTLVLLSGHAAGWIETLAETDSLAMGYNLSPSAIFGLAWLIIGIPLAAWLAVRGRVGLAGLAISPYVFPMYLLVLLWEWVERPSGLAGDISGSDPNEPRPTGPSRYLRSLAGRRPPRAR